MTVRTRHLLRDALDLAAACAGMALFAATVWLAVTVPSFVIPDRVASAQVATRGAP